ncbi:hypothetical protein [Nocardioides sp. zg-1228]|uniref:hypothetical protein n=1 Tax=Nocardioides sp. zg-1228 TaxID=2763008 RepID=UPI001642E94D|nr:hypothetical protein [Nocardioides sp. zg-1228]MBC2933305.1 hypothetical protein [Nocardioides sp. zg-1228]QSF56536.1 hypothetical protein JX575_12925 [Nocardioides sp. zg-1228]
MTTQTSPTARTRRFGPAAAGLLAIAALFAALVPVVLEVDSRLDRTRPMYDDRSRMEWLQYQTVLTAGRAEPLELAPGESVELAGERFTSSSGVVVEVRAEAPERPCVRTSNHHGDVTAWACVDLDEPPADPDLEVVDLTVAPTT